MIPNININIEAVEAQVSDPRVGLPDPVFFMIGRLTPFINVDLLIKSPHHGVLLTWRDDKYSGKGWHIPGGIIRFQEKLSYRLKEVARSELGISLNGFNGPLEVNEIIAPLQKDRSHFISLLYKGVISESTCNNLVGTSQIYPHKFRFFKTAPKDLLSWHEIYLKHF